MTPPLLVATSHGTDSLAGRQSIGALVDAVGLRLGPANVVGAFVDVERPRVGDVVVAAGRPCVVVPLLLSPGYHVHHDIAKAVAGQGHRAAATLGPDRRLAELMAQRLDESGRQPGDAVVMAAAGSTELRAREATQSAADLLSDLLGVQVTVGHLGGSGVRLGEAVDSVAGRRVALASYLLAAGHFDDMVRSAAVAVCARPLLDGGEPDPRLIDLVVDRYNAAVVAESQM